MDAVMFPLGVSVLLNMLLFRWALHEHRQRRRFEEENRVLERALRRLTTPAATRTTTASVSWLGWWLVAALVAVGVASLVWIS